MVLTNLGFLGAIFRIFAINVKSIVNVSQVVATKMIQEGKKGKFTISIHSVLNRADFNISFAVQRGLEYRNRKSSKMFDH